MGRVITASLWKNYWLIMMDNDLQDLLKSHLLTTEQRFDRLENKIDNLSDVVVSLARAETKLITLEESRHEQGRRIGHLEEQLHRVEESTNYNVSFRTNIVKAFWILLTAVATVGTGIYFGLGPGIVGT